MSAETYNMPDNPIDDFMKMDMAIGTDVVECPSCGAEVQCGEIFDDEIECPECGEVFEKND